MKYRKNLTRVIELERGNFFKVEGSCNITISYSLDLFIIMSGVQQ